MSAKKVPIRLITMYRRCGVGMGGRGVGGFNLPQRYLFKTFFRNIVYNNSLSHNMYTFLDVEFLLTSMVYVLPEPV